MIIDPPCESLEKHRAIGTTTRLKYSKASSNDWFAIFPTRGGGGGSEHSSQFALFFEGFEKRSGWGE